MLKNSGTQENWKKQIMEYANDTGLDLSDVEKSKNLIFQKIYLFLLSANFASRRTHVRLRVSQN